MPNESFWDFSLRIYRKPQVSDTCLSLQNTAGLDVNLLLFACWHGREFGPLAPQTLEGALQFSTQWATQVVKPLRKARTWMKSALAEQEGILSELPGVVELREQIKAVELRSERLQQQALENLALAQQLENTPLADTEHTAQTIQENLHKIVEASAVTLTPSITLTVTEQLAFLTSQSLS